MSEEKRDRISPFGKGRKNLQLNLKTMLCLKKERISHLGKAEKNST
jgi:hypothetical protein